MGWGGRTARRCYDRSGAEARAFHSRAAGSRCPRRASLRGRRRLEAGQEEGDCHRLAQTGAQPAARALLPPSHGAAGGGSRAPRRLAPNAQDAEPLYNKGITMKEIFPKEFWRI